MFEALSICPIYISWQQCSREYVHSCLFWLPPGDLDHIMACNWHSDQDEVVMEVQALTEFSPCNDQFINSTWFIPDSCISCPLKKGKSMVDTDRSTWQRLSTEFEDEGFHDLGINGHTYCKKGKVDSGGPLFTLQSYQLSSSLA